MNSKRLSQQQRRVIAARQQRHLDLSSESPIGKSGLIIAHFGKKVEILDDESQKTILCQLRRNLPNLATGDYIIWQADPVNQTPVIVARKQRQSALIKPDPMGKLKTIAANMTQMLIVMAVIPEPVEILIDSYLVAAHAMQINPIIVLNKIDLLLNDDSPDIELLLSLYEKLDYVVCQISSYDPKTLSKLTPYLHDHTSIVVGQSGVGKSSLLQTLLPNHTLTIGDLSQANLKGQHTTTNARYYPLPTGGSIIDSPGVREFSLQHLSVSDLIHGFVELAPFVGQCRFRNCQHEKEIDCAIQTGLQMAMDPRRRQSFLRLKKEYMGLKKH